MPLSKFSRISMPPTALISKKKHPETSGILKMAETKGYWCLASSLIAVMATQHIEADT